MLVRVTLPFLLKGKVQNAGEEVELSDDLAHDLISRKRAALMKPPPAAVPVPEELKPARAGRKGAKNAR